MLSVTRKKKNKTEENRKKWLQMGNLLNKWSLVVRRVIPRGKGCHMGVKGHLNQSERLGNEIDDACQ